MKCELCNEPLPECHCFAEACDCPYNATGTFKLEIQAAIRAAKAEAWAEGAASIEGAKVVHRNPIGIQVTATNPYTEQESENHE